VENTSRDNVNIKESKLARGSSDRDYGLMCQTNPIAGFSAM
jgi:hypothetical protein